MLKYVPDVSRSLFGILEGMHKRKLEEAEGEERIASPRRRVAGGMMSPAKRMKLSQGEMKSILKDLSEGNLTENTFKEHLMEAVEANATAGLGDDEDELGGKRKSKEDDDERQPLYLVPIYDEPKDHSNVIRHPLFDFFPMNVTP